MQMLARSTTQEKAIPPGLSTPSLKTASSGFGKEELREMMSEEDKIKSCPEFASLKEWAGETVDTGDSLWVQKVVLKKFGFCCDEATVKAFMDACNEQRAATSN
eukprot:TRINITY_DN66461_c5_g1_i3.p1 TRINITY_DN66461_c5_g1~~TRINITY_DN66461_c5_g1_i3.p1  ORF type:complete len:104 (-),score=16.88 TRINITY_DN66461_c5_g1_i3:262-573(-)